MSGPPTAEELIALLDQEGLLGPPAARDALRQQVFGGRVEVGAEDLAAILIRRWRATDGLSVGFLARARRFGEETDSIIEELSDALAGEPLTMRQTAMKSSRLHVRVATPDGSGRTAVVDYGPSGLADVVNAVNTWLAEAGARKRLVLLPTRGEQQAVLACSPERQELLRARGVLA